jgi:hypothetical protein
MTLKVTSIVLLSSLFAATSAYAAEGEKPVIFDDIDTDADGCISKSEATVRKDLTDNFDSIDKDKGGTICVDEYTAYHNIGREIPEEVEVPEVGAAPVK